MKKYLSKKLNKNMGENNREAKPTTISRAK